MSRVIRRYSNRRLYDTSSSRMITLAEIAELVKQGVEVQVIDHETGEDITELTLVQVLLEQTKGMREVLTVPLLLRELIKAGRSTMADFIKHSLLASVEAVVLTEEKARELVQGLVAKRRIGEKEGQELLQVLLRSAREREALLEEKIQQAVRGIIAELGLSTPEQVEDRIERGAERVLNRLGLGTEEGMREKMGQVIREILEGMGMPRPEEIKQFQRDLEEIKAALNGILRELRRGRDG